jgi:hypothetical protein
MGEGHLGGSIADCPECWAIAYEPGWYAVLGAASTMIQLPDEANGDVIVRLDDSVPPPHPSRRASHTSVAKWTTTSRRDGDSQPPR